MYDPTEWIGGGSLGYIMRHCRADYYQGSPLIERLNPLRYEIGFGPHRPARFVWNRKAWMNTRWANFNWWLWKRLWWERRDRKRQTRRRAILQQMVALDEEMGLYDEDQPA